MNYPWLGHISVIFLWYRRRILIQYRIFWPATIVYYHAEVNTQTTTGKVVYIALEVRALFSTTYLPVRWRYLHVFPEVPHPPNFHKLTSPRKRTVYCFCVVKMEDLYPIAVSFRFFVPNCGFSPKEKKIKKKVVKSLSSDLMETVVRDVDVNANVVSSKTQHWYCRRSSIHI